MIDVMTQWQVPIALRQRRARFSTLATSLRLPQLPPRHHQRCHPPLHLCPLLRRQLRPRSRQTVCPSILRARQHRRLYRRHRAHPQVHLQLPRPTFLRHGCPPQMGWPSGGTTMASGRRRIGGLGILSRLPRCASMATGLWSTRMAVWSRTQTRLWLQMTTSSK